MLVIKSFNKKSHVKRISLRVPIRMADAIEVDLEKSGYNKKQRASWFEDVIRDLIEIGNHEELIAEEFIEAGTTKSIGVQIKCTTVNMIDNLVIDIRNNLSEHVDRSSVIRTAIIQRLINNKII